MSDDARIRDAKPEDATAMRQCVEAAYWHYIPRMGKEPGPMLENYSSVIQRHDACVLELDGELIGVLVLASKEQGLTLNNLAVHPDFQGRGFGGRLLDYAESRARALGYGELTLYTHECMAENLAIYARRGYVETDRRTESGYHRVYMRKQLGASA